MLPLHRCFAICCCSLALLSACGTSSYNSTSGAASVATTTSGGTGTASGSSGSSNAGYNNGATKMGTHDTVVATSAIAGVISVEVGMPQTVSVTFNSSDGRAISGFALTDTLAKLPVGWTGPKTFGCETVSSGSGCVLNLMYSPPAFDPGETLTINYVFVDNDAEPQTVGTMTLAYKATTDDNIVGTISPSGQIAAIVGSSSGTQPVVVTYDTDDGHPASGLMITTDLTALPPGWTSSASSLSCAAVSTGNGCQLMLTYSPTTFGMGTLKLDYSYSDDSGTAKTGSNNIAYAATTNDHVVATPSPSGQINAVAGAGSQLVDVTFTTDDGAPATNVVVTSDLAALPPGWSSSSAQFSCATVSTGSSCRLPLMYAPTGAGSGMVTIAYTYVDDAGVSNSGSLNIPYKSTTNNNVAGSFNPTALNVSVGSSTSVSLNFATDDGAPASGLSITSGLSALPPGWTSAANTFSCSTVSSGSTCSLTLEYSPVAADSGMLTLGFAYSSGSGVAKTANAQVMYTATP